MLWWCCLCLRQFLQIFFWLRCVLLEYKAVVLVVAILELQEVLHCRIECCLWKIVVVNFVFDEAVILWRMYWLLRRRKGVVGWRFRRSSVLS